MYLNCKKKQPKNKCNSAKISKTLCYNNLLFLTIESTFVTSFPSDNWFPSVPVNKSSK